MRASDRAWLTLTAGVIGYNVLCPDGETLSEGADAYMSRHPWLVRAIAFALACHVCNLVPDRYDAVHWLFLAARKQRRR